MKRPWEAQRDKFYELLLATSEGRRGSEWLEGILEKVGYVHSKRVPQKALVEFLETSRKVLRDWAKDGLPRNNDGTYDLRRVLPWLRARWSEGVARGAQEEKWLVEKRKWDARRSRLEYLTFKGAFVKVADVEQANVRKVLVIKAAFLGLPNELAPALEDRKARDIHKILDGRIREIIKEFAGPPQDERDGAETEGAPLKYNGSDGTEGERGDDDRE